MGEVVVYLLQKWGSQAARAAFHETQKGEKTTEPTVYTQIVREMKTRKAGELWAVTLIIILWK